MEELNARQEATAENEFEIGTPEGLRRFNEYVEDAYKALEHSSGFTDGVENVVLEEGKSAYAKLRILIEQSESKFAEDEEIPDADIEALQTLYDEMWVAADALASSEQTPSTNDDSEKEDSPSNSAEDTMSSTIVIEEASGSAPIPPLEEASIESQEKALRTAELLVDKTQQLVAHFAAPVNAHPDSGTFNAAQSFYDELKRSAVRVEAIYNTLKKATSDNSIDALEFKHFHDQLGEVEENVDQLIIGLESVFGATGEKSEIVGTEVTERKFESTPELAGAVNTEEIEEDTFVTKRSTGILTVGKEAEEFVKISITTPPKPISAPRPPQTQIHNALPQNRLPRKESIRSVNDNGELRTELAPLIISALKDVRYRTFVEHAFTSASEFETSLMRRVNEIETPSKLDSVLGIEHKSAFHTFLRDQTIAEIERFDQQPREQLRQQLIEKDIEYEVYVEWMEGFYDMLQMVRIPTSMKFGELFIRAEMEELMHHYFRAPQAKV